MKTYTVHVRHGHAPVLVKEAFAWAALLFGPFWLLIHRAWLGAVGAFAVFGAVLFVPGPARGFALAAAMLLMGLVGRDLWRWSLARRGYALVAVVAAPGADAAFLRFMDGSGTVPA